MNKDYLEKCLSNGMSTRQIEKDCGLNHRTISYWISKYGLNDKSKYRKYDSYKFEKIDTKEKAYILGFLLADGSIDEKNIVEVAVSLYDKEIVEYISKILQANINYDHTVDKKARRFPRARLQKKIVDILKFTGGRLKADIHYPRVRDDLERYLIQGLFDADGCLTFGRRKDKNRLWQKISFTSQLKILEGVQQYLIKKLNISTALRPKGKEKCYVLEFANLSDVLTFLEHIYPNDSFIILKRKYLKYKALRLELEENGEGKRIA